MEFQALAVLAALLVPVTGLAAEIEGTWQGSYTCNQGLTGLTLTLASPRDGTARGVFRFYQIDSNPGVPDGCFAMSGTASGEHITLQAGSWLYHPLGYVTVDLTGTISPDGAVLTGSIVGPNCTSFTLRRVSDDPLPAACRPADAPVS